MRSRSGVVGRKISGRAVWALAAALLALGCGKAESTPGGAGRCTGKCDGDAVPATLKRIDLSRVVECRAQLDTSTSDPFFQDDLVYCRSVADAHVSVRSVHVTLESTDRRFFQDALLEGDQLDGRWARVARLSGRTVYPLHLRVTFGYTVSGLRPADGSVYDLYGRTTDFASRTQLGTVTAERPFTAGLPFDVMFASLWPSERLSQAWKAGNVSYVVVQLSHDVELPPVELAVAGTGSTPRQSTRLQRVVSVGDGSLGALAQPFAIAVGRGATAAVPTASIEIGPRDATAIRTSVAITAPGYYVLDVDGTSMLTAPELLPRLAAGSAMDVDAGANEASDAGVAVEPDAFVEAPDAGPPPCGGACTESQVCVGSTCVARAEQVQERAFSGCNAATRACDPGEDGDCAEGHACVGGFCRRRECQAQDWNGFSCNGRPVQPCEADDDHDCADGHACVGGFCRRLACQTQDWNGFSCTGSAVQPCDGDENSDCAEGHVCVAHVCRRVMCQTQNWNGFSCTGSAVQPCDLGEDADCAAEHTCRDGRCARNGC